MKKCKVCGEKTDVSFNIDFKKTPICEQCATAIFLQQANWYAEQQRKKLNIPDVIGRSEQSFCPNCHTFHYSKEWDGYCSKSCWDGIEAK